MAVREWFDRNPDRPMVFPLEHQYTQQGLSIDLVKGNDRLLAELLFQVADAGGLKAFFAQINRHVCYGAWGPYDYDRYYGRGRPRYWESEVEDDDGEFDPSKVEIGDELSDDLVADQWRDRNGHRRRPIGAVRKRFGATVATARR